MEATLEKQKRAAGERERELQAKLFSGPDAKEGLAAFMDKRKAEFGAGTTW